MGQVAAFRAASPQKSQSWALALNLLRRFEKARRRSASWGSEHPAAWRLLGPAPSITRAREFVVEKWSPSNSDALEYYDRTQCPKAHRLHR